MESRSAHLSSFVAVLWLINRRSQFMSITLLKREPQTRYAIAGCAETLAAVLKLLPRTAAERGGKAISTSYAKPQCMHTPQRFYVWFSSKWSERRNLQ